MATALPLNPTSPLPTIRTLVTEESTDMLARLIEWSVRNVFLVLVLSLAVTAAGVYAVLRTPLDALPDLSDVQVIVFTEVPGQGPQVVEAYSIRVTGASAWPSTMSSASAARGAQAVIKAPTPPAMRTRRDGVKRS